MSGADHWAHGVAMKSIALADVLQESGLEADGVAFLTDEQWELARAEAAKRRGRKMQPPSDSVKQLVARILEDREAKARNGFDPFSGLPGVAS